MKLRLGGLHLQILALIILPLSLALLAIAIAGINIHQGAMRQLVAERDERAARAAADAISEQLHHREAAILGLSRRLAGEVTATTLIEQSNFLYPDFDLGLGVFDREGLLLASNSPTEWDRWSLTAIIPSLHDGNSYFSQPIVTGNESLVLVGALGGERVVLGVFSIESIMRSTVLEAGLGPVGYRSFLTDQEGRVLRIVGEQLPSDDLKHHSGVEAALRGEVGSSFIPAEDGEHVVAFSPIQPTGWALIIEEPWESVASPVLDLSLAAPLALIPPLLVTLIALWFGARQVIRPLRELEAQAEELANSNYGAIKDPVGGITEIQRLQSTLAWLANNIRESQAALQRYIGAITNAQEDERKRLARDLHDETIQDLIAIDQQIQMIRLELEESTALSERLDGLREEVSLAIHELRRVIRALRPIYLDDLGLVPALQVLAKETESESGIQVGFEITGDVVRLQPGFELAVYRIAQEAISNTLRHANANHISLEIWFEEGLFSLDIRDNGVGFSLPNRLKELGARGHFGLMGMVERAELIGASFDIRSNSTSGTQIRIELPLAKTDRA